MASASERMSDSNFVNTLGGTQTYSWIEFFAPLVVGGIALAVALSLVDQKANIASQTVPLDVKGLYAALVVGAVFAIVTSGPAYWAVNKLAQYTVGPVAWLFGDRTYAFSRPYIAFSDARPTVVGTVVHMTVAAAVSAFTLLVAGYWG